MMVLNGSQLRPYVCNPIKNPFVGRDARTTWMAQSASLIVLEISLPFCYM